MKPTRATLLAAATLLWLVWPMHGQRRLAPDAGCVQQKGEYVCNWSALRQALDNAHLVTVETGPMDRTAASQLNALVGNLDKQRAAPGQPGDLTFVLRPTDSTGVDLGPSDHELLTLRVYAPSVGNDRGVLVWVETLRGPGDRPWPAQVHAVIEQFEHRLHKG